MAIISGRIRHGVIFEVTQCIRCGFRYCIEWHLSNKHNSSKESQKVKRFESAAVCEFDRIADMENHGSGVTAYLRHPQNGKETEYEL